MILWIIRSIGTWGDFHGTWPEIVYFINNAFIFSVDCVLFQVSWTQALREIVTNCYEFHGRQDLMPIFACDSSDLAARRISSNSTASASHNSEVSSNFKSEGVVEEPREITVQGQRLQLTPVVSAAHSQVVGLATTVGGTQMQHHQQQQHPHTLHQYAQVVQAVTNPDGTMSIIQVDSPSSIISLPDGTTAHLAHIDNSGHHGVSTLAEVATATAEQQQQGQHHTIEINGAEELQGPEGGHFLLAGEDGQGKKGILKKSFYSGKSDCVRELDREVAI